MMEPLSRAHALGQIVANSEKQSVGHPVVTTLVTCCMELADTGASLAALGLIQSVEHICPELDDEWRIRLGLAKAQALRAVGRQDESLRISSHLRGTLRQTLDLLPSERRRLAIVEAGTLWQLNAFDESLVRLVALREELLNEGDSTELASCAFELSSAFLFRGDLKRSRTYAMDAVVSARRCGSREREALGLDNLGRIDKYLCRWNSAEEYTKDALVLHEQCGHQFSAHITRRNLGIMAWKRGRLDQSLEYAKDCLAESQYLGSDLHGAYANLLVVNILIHKGETSEADQMLGEHCAPQAEHRNELLREELRAEILLENGEYDAALSQVEFVAPFAIAMAPRGDIASELCRRRSEALFGLGRHLESHEEALSAVAAFSRSSDRYEEAATYRTLALSAAALGKPVEAKKWFDQGFAYYDDIETPYEWGKLWMAYGDWLRGPHAAEYASVTGAFEAYQAARDHFEGMGALGKLAEAEARLAECAASMETPPQPTPATENRKPQRRPRGAAELDRRSEWARDTYGLITRNKVFLDLLRDVAKLAQSGSPILILGESGTGKERVAEGIHRLSGRSGKFMPVNCGALPRDVIESELFGHMAGAFTGAARDKPGLVEACHEGTAFLDEIGEMSIDLQSKLLRFLETGEFRRVGSTRVLTVNTLVIAATNRDRASLESGVGFRADLYYRLAHAVFTLPPLRRRGEDIDLLIDHFLDDARARFGKRVRLSAAARNRMIAYSWPGNVRQLRSNIHRLAILASTEGEIGPAAIELSEADAPTGLMQELEQAERRRIVEALAQANGVRTEAAKALGMSRTTFLGKMKRFGIR